MKRFERLMMGVFVLAFMLGGSWAYAQGSASGEAAGSKWEFDVIPYFWMAGMGGDVTVKGREAQTSTNFSDIWDNLDFGAQMHVEAKKGKWGIFFDGTYLDLSVSGEACTRLASGPLKRKGRSIWMCLEEVDTGMWSRNSLCRLRI
jgi:hypothetical protein